MLLSDLLYGVAVADAVGNRLEFKRTVAALDGVVRISVCGV